jgi:hypothetical protein
VDNLLKSPNRVLDYADCRALQIVHNSFSRFIKIVHNLSKTLFPALFYWGCSNFRNTFYFGRLSASKHKLNELRQREIRKVMNNAQTGTGFLAYIYIRKGGLYFFNADNYKLL